MMVLRRWTMRRAVTLCLAAAMAASLGGCPSPDGDGSGTLAGSWRGDLSYEANLLLNDQPYGQRFEKSFSVTFSDQGQPDALDLATANGSDVVRLSTANLVNVGDSDEQTFELESPNGTSKTVKVAATVTSVSRDSTAFRMTLDVTVEFVGAGSMSGVYTVNATLQDDDTVLWASTSDLMVDSDKVTLPVMGSSNGTLTRL
jgi:hypothetical protein